MVNHKFINLSLLNISMRDLLPIGMTFIALVVVFMIGASVFIMTQTVKV
jgi:hypothetical protein